MKKKSFFILFTVIILIGISIFFIFFYNKTAKTSKIGNNSTSQEIVDYILNISSYEAKVEIQIESNKNKNRYVLKQQYNPQNEIMQEVLEPSNIAGTKIIKNGNQLKLENSNLSLSSIFENYQYVSDNNLDLSCFIENYKQDSKANWKEENEKIVMKTKKEQEEKTLSVDRKTGKPIKLEIKCANKNTGIYILYNEVNINCL